MLLNALGLLVLLTGCQTQTTVTKEKKKLTVSPALIDVGTLTVGDTTTATIHLTHVQGPEVKVVTVSMLNVAGSWFTTDETDLPVVAIEGEADLTVQYTPMDAGYHRARLTVVTNEEDDPEHLVDLRGAAAYPSADIYPEWIDFGPVETGVTASQIVNLRNSGVVRLDLAALSFSSALFSSSQVPTSLDAGEEIEIPIAFSPVDATAAEAELDLDLGAAPGRTLSLRGNDCENGNPALYDRDGDGVTQCAGDCDDSRPEVRPGQSETCDTFDNNCDGSVDEGTDCVDDDGDGVTEMDGDCDDSRPLVYPGASEDLTDGVDNDCDGVVDLGLVDGDADGYALEDCNDADATVFPGAAELADGLDNDCDGKTDEGTSLFDDDGDGYSEAKGDCNDANVTIAPGIKELPDGIDNNCDGRMDEGTVVVDDDGDGFTENGGDCDDNSAAVHPGASEVADGIDNDCDGSVQ